MEQAFSDKKEKISVVIPAYNAEETLERAVLSVLGQSYSNIELIVVNDGSTDGTRELLEELCRRYPELRAINKPNGGVSSARNAGIRAATGRYLVTLDDDDYIDSTMLEDMYSRLRADEADTVICGFRNVYPDGRTEDFSVDIEGCFGREEFINGPLVPMYDRRLISTHSNKLYDMEIIHENGLSYVEGRQINEDILFCVKYLGCCRRISVTDKVYMNYVQHSFGESLISSFHEDGITSCFPVLGAVQELLGGQAVERTVNEMNIRMLLHILSFNGLMYRYSGYSDERKLKLLVEFCGNPAFSELLIHTRPQDIKTRVAHVLLKHRRYRAYHQLCRLLYRA